MVTLPKEQQTAFQRWEMTSFGDERASAVAEREKERHAEEVRRAAEEAERRVMESLQAQQDLLEVGPPPPPLMSYPSVEELEAIREEARQSGYEEGHTAGHADAMAAAQVQIEQELAHARALAVSFADAVQHADQLIANEVLDLALHLAKGMLKQSLQVKRELILPIVREAIEYLPVLQQPALLMLHPDDAATVRAGIERIMEAGATEFVAVPFSNREATIEVLQSMM